MLFSENWLRNHPQFLLYFLIHIDVFMLCRKFKLIPTAIFQVMAIVKNMTISEKYPVLYIVHGFFQKLALKSSPIFIIFFDVYRCPYAMLKV